MPLATVLQELSPEYEMRLPLRLFRQFVRVMVFIGFALVFSIGPVNRAYRRSRRWIEGAMAGFFAFAGLRLLTARL